MLHATMLQFKPTSHHLQFIVLTFIRNFSYRAYLTRSSERNNRSQLGFIQSWNLGNLRNVRFPLTFTIQRSRRSFTTNVDDNHHTGTVEYGHSTWEQDDHPFGESLQIHPLLKSNGIERRLILLLQLTILELWFGMIEWDLLPSLQFKLIQPRFMELIGRLSSLYRFVSISTLTNNVHVECRMSHDEQQVEKEIWCVIDLFSW